MFLKSKKSSLMGLEPTIFCLGGKRPTIEPQGLFIYIMKKIILEIIDFKIATNDDFKF